MKLITNVTVHTMDKWNSTASAVAWENDEIVEIGAEKDLLRKFGTAEKIDGSGRTLLPGFIDPHIHFLDGVIYMGALDCTPEAVPSIIELKKLLKSKAAETATNRWIVGHGYDTLKFVEKRNPTRQELDEAVPDHPVVVTQYSFHECVANSRALELAGINRTTPQPFAGKLSRIQKVIRQVI